MSAAASVLPESGLVLMRPASVLSEFTSHRHRATWLRHILLVTDRKLMRAARFRPRDGVSGANVGRLGTLCLREETSGADTVAPCRPDGNSATSPVQAGPARGSGRREVRGGRSVGSSSSPRPPTNPASPSATRSPWCFRSVVSRCRRC
jgi:hypothetical protein